MYSIKPKKSLGQHFLKDQNIAKKIVNSLSFSDYKNILEIGPGTGVLSQFLFEKTSFGIKLIEIDKESVDFLKKKFPDKIENLIHEDFLKSNPDSFFKKEYAVIGNFPYNISSQIFFKILGHKDTIMEVVCMIQKEVAERIASPPGNKKYGILSVILQTYYTIEYLFTINQGVFYPPPKVKSAVIRLKRNDLKNLQCNEEIYFKVIKTSFNQRRKMLSNSLKSMLTSNFSDKDILKKRPEELSVMDFINLTIRIEQGKTR